MTRAGVLALVVFALPAAADVGEALAELGRRERRTIAVVASFSGAPVPAGELASWLAPHAVRQEGAELLVCGPDNTDCVAYLEQRPYLALGEVRTDQPLSVSRRGNTLVLDTGTEDSWTALAPHLHAIRAPVLPALASCEGPRVTHTALRWPLSRVAAELGPAVEVAPALAERVISLHLEQEPLERALAIVAFASGCRVVRRGEVSVLAEVPPAGPPLSGTLRGADPAGALALLARATGRVLAHEGASAESVSLELEQIASHEALELIADTLGATLTERANGELVAQGGQGIAHRRATRPAKPEPSAAKVQAPLDWIERRLARIAARKERDLPYPWWSDGLELLLRDGGPLARERTAAKLATWLPASNPATRADVARALARSRAKTELAKVERLLARGKPMQALAALPELRALECEIRAADPEGARELVQAIERLGNEAEPWTYLFARSGGRLQGVLHDGKAPLALIDGQVLARGERLLDRAGFRQDVVIESIDQDHVVLRCRGKELRLFLSDP